MNRTSFIVCAILVAAGVLGIRASSTPASPTDALDTQVRAVLEEQAVTWNRGDIDAFMQKYWKSEKLAFVGSSGVTRGWQTVLERYKRVYPDRAAMGNLTFSNLEVTPLGKDAALVLGHWQLERAADRPGGVFSLVLRRFPEGWRIIHDHTSSVAPPAKSN